MSDWTVCLNIIGGGRECFEVTVKQNMSNPEDYAVRLAQASARVRGYTTTDADVQYVQERKIT